MTLNAVSVFPVLAGHPGCFIQHNDGKLWQWHVWHAGVWCFGKSFLSIIHILKPFVKRKVPISIIVI